MTDTERKRQEDGVAWLREQIAKKRNEARELERLAWKMEHRIKESERAAKGGKL